MDITDYMRFAGSLVFVLALIGMAALALRFFGWGDARPFGIAPSRQRRLQIVETLFLDPKRKLVLVRRDGAEHLLALGGSEICVVESGIAIETATRTHAEAEAA